MVSGSSETPAGTCTGIRTGTGVATGLPPLGESDYNTLGESELITFHASCLALNRTSEPAPLRPLTVLRHVVFAFSVTFSASSKYLSIGVSTLSIFSLNFGEDEQPTGFCAFFGLG